MPDITTVESAYSRGSTKFDKWEAEFEEQWNRPLLIGQMAMMINSIPPEVREFLPQDALKVLEDKISSAGGNDASKQIRRRQEPVREQGIDVQDGLPGRGKPLRPAAQKYGGQVPRFSEID